MPRVWGASPWAHGVSPTPNDPLVVPPALRVREVFGVCVQGFGIVVGVIQALGVWRGHAQALGVLG